MYSFLCVSNFQCVNRQGVTNKVNTSTITTPTRIVQMEIQVLYAYDGAHTHTLTLSENCRIKEHLHIRKLNVLPLFLFFATQVTKLPRDIISV